MTSWQLNTASLTVHKAPLLDNFLWDRLGVTGVNWGYTVWGAQQVLKTLQFVSLKIKSGPDK